MASTQEFRHRIKSVNNTKQITKAMEMVASVKMQKAVKLILDAREYVQDSWNMLLKLAKLTLPENHPLLKPKMINKTAIILVTSDRGLCGAYNSDIFKKLMKYCSNEVRTKNDNSSQPQQVGASNNIKSPLPPTTHYSPTNCDIIAIGKKGADFVHDHNLGNLIAAFPEFGNDIAFEDVLPISTLSNDEYMSGNYDRIVIIYSHFVSSLKQTPVVRQILPIDTHHIDMPDLWLGDSSLDQASKTEEYIFEPDADQILKKLLQRFIRLQIYGAILEANASEHSARMVGMQNATDSAKELIDEMTLTYNSIRQNSITNEIAEICAGAESMK